MGEILAPVNGRGSADRLASAGAGELYIGFWDKEWVRVFGEDAELNRTSGFRGMSNALSFEEMLDEVCSVNAKLYCTFNSAHYTPKQIDFIQKRYFSRLANAGFNGIIVAGGDLIQAAHECNLRVVAGTMCAIYNADIAGYYAQRGANRIILPRDLALADIESIIREHPQIEYEVFLMRNGCVFSDSHCLGLHRKNHPSLCSALHESKGYIQQSSMIEHPTSFNDHKFSKNEECYRYEFHRGGAACGLCALWRFEKMGVSAYKIVGRCDPMEYVEADISLARENIEVAQMCKCEREYLEQMFVPDYIEDLCTMQGLCCYYPQVVFGE